MASIKSLLNPAPELPVHTSPSFGASYNSPSISMARSLNPGRHRLAAKYKIPKDAPVFKENDPQGEIRYPPCEDRPDPIADEHRKLELYPWGRMQGLVNILERFLTGARRSLSRRRRAAVNLRYIFRYGDPGERWIMMWDYNIGLVRITHLFKALGYTKTTPAKVLAQNPGLRDICHSITGGAIAAQGYWMPFEAARALAIRFCHPIRYALTPHIRPGLPKNVVIDRATKTAHYYRSLEAPTTTSSTSCLLRTSTSTSPSASASPWRTEIQTHIPICPALPDRRAYKLPRRSYADSIASTRGSSSEPYCMSPSSPGSFTPVNAPRSHTEAFLSCTDPSPSLSGSGSIRPSYADSEAESSRSRFSPVNRRVHRLGKVLDKYDSDTDTSESVIDSVDDEHDGDWREMESPSSVSVGSIASASASADVDADAERRFTPRSEARMTRSPPKHFAQEVKAAHALVHLHMQEATADEDEGGDEDDAVPLPDKSSDMGLGRVLDQGGAGARKRRRASV
ncbi:apses transcription factor Xbp1 [Penicillium manginii]|uniref:apses transcription factor Xbp1 n=1 Tax=Penicillium manginii TaxID=203109 RepID=UPI002549434E|nr:apses transcription factor Xbp1 [Penicillium manginii]KAJ5743791.1 apses transcription factor Xbp1 [Penicillium manginii]